MILTIAMAAALAVQAAQTNQATPPRRARANLSQYFSTDDYPPNALVRSATGTVSFRLDIDAEGMVTGCTITRSSNDAALDSATCAILLGRASYEPARDAAGRPVRGKDEGRVTWRLPTLPGLPFALLRTVSRLSSNGAGSLDCVLTNNGVADPEAGPNHCGGLAASDALYMLRQVPAPAQVTLVSVIGPADSGVEAVGEDEAGYGVLYHDQVADLIIGQDGRVVRCRIVTGGVPSAAPADATAPESCGPQPGPSPLFVPSTDPAPRLARYRSAFYVKGWPAPPASATNLP